MWPEAVAVSEISLFPKHHVSGGYRIGVIPIPSEMHTLNKKKHSKPRAINLGC